MYWRTPLPTGMAGSPECVSGNCLQTGRFLHHIRRDRCGKIKIPPLGVNYKNTHIKKASNLSSENQKLFLKIFQDQFEKNRAIHKDILWTDVLEKLKSNPEKIKSLYQKENTGW